MNVGGAAHANMQHLIQAQQATTGRGEEARESPAARAAEAQVPQGSVRNRLNEKA